METHTNVPQNRTLFQEVNDPSLHTLRTLREGHKGSHCFDSQADKQILLFQLNIPGTQNVSPKKQYHKILPCHRPDIRKTTWWGDSRREAGGRCHPHAVLRSAPHAVSPCLCCHITLPIFPRTGSPTGIKIKQPMLVSVI